MKIKINKEQIAYLNSLEDTEAKKNFLMDCFLNQLEVDFFEENNTIAFNDGTFKTSDPKAIEFFTLFPNLCKESNPSNLGTGVDSIDSEYLIFKDGVCKVKNTPINRRIANLDFPKIKVTPEVIESIEKAYNDKSTGLTKEDLKSITQPKANPVLKYVVEYLGRSREDEQERFLEEVKEMSKYFNAKVLNEIPVEKRKIYSQEDLKIAFEASRQDIMGLTLFRDFEEYLKSITP